MDEITWVFDPPVLFRLVDVTGVVANSLLGAMVARRMRFDLVGFVVLGVITGLGGGMLRDMLLNMTPVAMIDRAYLTSALIAALLAYLVPLRGNWARRVLVLADVVAVGCWAATGTIKALGIGFAPVPSIMCGVLTGVGGGIMRDALTGKIPAIFGGNPLYATLTVIGAAEAWICTALGSSDLAMGLSILTCSVLGLLSRRFGWSLPNAPDWELPRFRARKKPPAAPLS